MDDAISFSVTQIIAGVGVLISGITALFWLLLAAKDAQLKETSEHNRVLAADLSKARDEVTSVTNRLIDQLGGAIKASELATKEVSATLGHHTRAIGEHTTALSRLIDQTTMEHESMLAALERIGQPIPMSARASTRRRAVPAGEVDPAQKYGKGAR